MLLLVSNLFEHVYILLSSNTNEIDKLIELLNSFMDRNDEALMVAKFLFKNKCHIFSPKSHQIGLKCICFWELLFQLLIEDSSESSQICSDIISSLTNSDHSKFEPMSMISHGLDICIQNLNNTRESFKFMLDQYDLVSQCESRENDNEVIEVEFFFQF